MPIDAAACGTASDTDAQKACIMRSNNPELVRRMTDVLDEIIPAMPVDDGMPARIAQIGVCMLEAAAEGQASYESLLAVASAEMAATQARFSDGKRFG